MLVSDIVFMVVYCKLLQNEIYISNIKIKLYISGYLFSMTGSYEYSLIAAGMSGSQIQVSL